MKCITMSKPFYEYAFTRISFQIHKKIGKLLCLYYWIGDNSNTHYLYLNGDVRNLVMTVQFTNQFVMPNDETLLYGKRWHIQLPLKYNISNFIQKVVFERKRINPYHPVRTYIGISPKMEKLRQREFRRKVKHLMISLADEIKRGEIDYRTAATHFSASTGLCIDNALRFFRRFYDYV